MGDKVTGLDAGLVGRGAVNWRDHFDKALFLGNLDTKAAKLAPGLYPHIGCVIGRQVTRVWIQ